MKSKPFTRRLLAAMAIASPALLPAQSAVFTFADPLEADIYSTMIGDVIGGRVEIDLATGDYTVTWQAADGFWFIGPLDLVLQLGNADLGVVVTLWGSPGQSLQQEFVSYSGNEPALMEWRPGDAIATSGGAPEFPVSFVSGIFSTNPMHTMMGLSLSDLVDYRGLLEGDPVDDGNDGEEPLPPEPETPEEPQEPDYPVEERLDSDGDGIPDDEDLLPFSDARPTVFLLGSDTGIVNLVDETGVTLADLIQAFEAEAAATARNKGQYVSALNRAIEELVLDGWLTDEDHGKLARLIAKSRK